MGLGAHCQWVLVEGLGEEPAGSVGAVTPLTREEGACRIRGPCAWCPACACAGRALPRNCFSKHPFVCCGQRWAGCGLQLMLGTLR